MYDENNVQVKEIVVEDLELPAGGSVLPEGLSDHMDDGDRNESLLESGEDNGQAATSDEFTSGDVSQGDLFSGNAAGGNISPNSVSGNNFYTEVPDYSESILSMQETLVSINATLFLIFLFLIMSWTEKKISLSVKKFTRERRR